jgi:hypothetical protein
VVPMSLPSTTPRGIGNNYSSARQALPNPKLDTGTPAQDPCRQSSARATTQPAEKIRAPGGRYGRSPHQMFAPGAPHGAEPLDRTGLLRGEAQRKAH